MPHVRDFLKANHSHLRITSVNRDSWSWLAFDIVFDEVAEEFGEGFDVLMDASSDCM
jgi:hypothetical protein